MDVFWRTARRSANTTDRTPTSIRSPSEYWEVRLEGTPGRDKVIGSFALGVAGIVLGIALQIVVKKWDVRQAEEEEEERLNEQPLV